MCTPEDVATQILILYVHHHDLILKCSRYAAPLVRIKCFQQHELLMNLLKMSDTNSPNIKLIPNSPITWAV